MGGKKLGKAQLEEFGYKECGTKNVYKWVVAFFFFLNKRYYVYIQIGMKRG